MTDFLRYERYCRECRRHETYPLLDKEEEAPPVTIKCPGCGKNTFRRETHCTFIKIVQDKVIVHPEHQCKKLGVYKGVWGAYCAEHAKFVDPKYVSEEELVLTDALGEMDDMPDYIMTTEVHEYIVGMMTERQKTLQKNRHRHVNELTEREEFHTVSSIAASRLCHPADSGHNRLLHEHVCEVGRTKRVWEPGSHTYCQKYKHIDPVTFKELDHDEAESRYVEALFTVIRERRAAAGIPPDNSDDEDDI